MVSSDLQYDEADESMTAQKYVMIEGEAWSRRTRRRGGLMAAVWRGLTSTRFLLEQVGNLVTRCLRDRETDVGREEVEEIPGLLFGLSAVKTGYASSPDRSASECMPLGLRPGSAVDCASGIVSKMKKNS